MRSAPKHSNRHKGGISLVILTYNEIEGIKHIFDKIPQHIVDECFAIDGGSTDGTREFLTGRRMRVVVQQKRGRGEAFRIATQLARGDKLIFFGPDGNENPNDISRIKLLLDEGCDMAIASRFMSGARNEEDDLTFPWRAWANRVFTFLANSIWRGRITDTINGFRGVRKEVFQKLNPDGEGYTIEYQMSIRAMKLKMRVAEFPTYEGNRIGRETTASSIPTGIKFAKLLLKEIFRGKRF